MKGGCLRANGLLHPYRRTTFCSIVSIRAWTPWDSVGSLSPCCAGRIPRCTRSAARTSKSLPISRGTGWAFTCRTTWTHRVSRRHPRYFGRISRRCNPFRRRAIETNETRADLARRAKQRKHGAGGDTSTHGRQLGKLRPIVNRPPAARALFHFYGHRNRIACGAIEHHLHRNVVSGRRVGRDHGVDLPEAHETGSEPAEENLRGQSADGHAREADGFRQRIARRGFSRRHGWNHVALARGPDNDRSEE